MIAKNSDSSYIKKMKISKYSINVTRIFASLVIGFTHISFAATEEPTMLEIPPPPSLQNPATNASSTNAMYKNGNSKTPATVGTIKTESNTGSEKSPSGFSKGNGVSATSTQSDNANAVNAAAEAARRAATPTTPTGVMWINQIFPAANTMYSTPQRK